MSNTRQRTRKSTDLRSDGSPFQLPPGVTFSKQRLGDNWAYVFRHQGLGELGRIVLQVRSDGQCQISCEVVGEPTDPMTIRRAEIFGPLGIALSDRIAAATGPLSGVAYSPWPLLSPPTPKEMIKSKLIPCERCGTMVAILIFAPEATDPGRFEDYARKMYAQYTHLNLPTWIIGPSLGSGPPMDRPADIFKVWPERIPMERLRPAEFNPLINQLATRHCVKELLNRG